VKAEHVEKAVNEKVYRNNRIEERLQELMEEGTLIVDTSGAKTGQVNGLAVLDLGALRRVRQQLQEKGVVSDEWGGDTLYVDCSALTKQGVDRLLAAIALQAELLELKANPNRRAKGNVIESGLEPGGPTATVVALSIGYTLVNTFLVEAIFAWPGIGNYIATAVTGLDYPAIMGVTIFSTVAYVLLNLIADIIVAMDPRVRV
jgi:hypothetical protein